MKAEVEASTTSSPGRWTAIERRIRLGSGLLLALYVIPHLLNHALGLLSFDAMEAMREIVSPLWQFSVWRWILPATLVIHFSFSLLAIIRRTTLSMPRAELFQLGLGLLVPVLLLEHIAGTRVTTEVTGMETGYDFVLASIGASTWSLIRQTFLVIVVWFHVCLGLNMWLRHRAWWRRLNPVTYAAAVLLPSLALLGFWRATSEMVALMRDPDERAATFGEWLALDETTRDAIGMVPPVVGTILAVATLAALIIRQLVLRARRRRQGVVKLRHPAAGTVPLLAGQSVLEALRSAGVDHASVCGGRGRCTTCRFEVGAGGETLPVPSALEAAALNRIGAGERVRLACQTRPDSDLSIAPLVNPDAVSPHRKVRGGVTGHEREVVALFVDLRESTRLGEDRLPYDVVFILNRFFSEMTDALEESGGHYAQFAGDGLLALYGLECSLDEAVRGALSGAAQMVERIERLNEELATELPRPLRIGIGIHAGEAIVGDMGPPSTPIHSAIGDTINIAARLEAMTKELGAAVVVSADTVARASLTYPDESRHQVDVRGRVGAVDVFAIDKPGDSRRMEAG